MRVAIIDYGMGNLHSVFNAFALLGALPSIVSDPVQLYDADFIVLPGVGAFGDGMKNLRERGWIPVMTEVVMNRETPFLGICLGMQLLATTGTEFGQHEGLGWIKGSVVKLAETDTTRIPHIGWNDVHPKYSSTLFPEHSSIEDFYFVHSYVLEPEDNGVIAASCFHGREFVAAIQENNIVATQFHPEKSQKSGLSLLRRFLAMKEVVTC